MLEKLRAQPDHVKQRLVWGLTIAIFSLVVVVWGSSFGARAGSSEAREKALSPLDGFFSLFEGVIADSKAGALGSLPENSAKTETLPKEALQATALQAVSQDESGSVVPMTEGQSNAVVSGMVVIDSKAVATSSITGD